MNTIGRVMSTAVAAATLATMVPGHLWAQATDGVFTEETARAGEPRAQLVVKNNHWLDAHLYLVRGSMRTSLGFMAGLGKRDFELPSAATLPGEDVQILVHLIGGGASYLTPAIYVNGGDVVELTVQNLLALSTVVISSGS